MHQALLIIDIQPSFAPPQWLIDGIQKLIGTLPSVATVERHDESKTPFHAWCYKSDGRLVKVKAPGEYPEGFDKATRGLKKARIQSYKGFVFISLDVHADNSLEDFLGDARSE